MEDYALVVEEGGEEEAEEEAEEEVEEEEVEEEEVEEEEENESEDASLKRKLEVVARLAERFPMASLRYLRHVVGNDNKPDLNHYVNKILDQVNYPRETTRIRGGLTEVEKISDLTDQILIYQSAWPDSNMEFIKNTCIAYSDEPETLSDFLQICSRNGNFVKRERQESLTLLDPKDSSLKITALLKDQGLLPDIDPNFLRTWCEDWRGNPDGLRESVLEMVNKKGYPTLQNYRTQQSYLYTHAFNMVEFLMVHPDPKNFFSLEKRRYELDVEAANYAIYFLYNKFNRFPMAFIEMFFEEYVYFMDTFRVLQNVTGKLKKPLLYPRSPVQLPEFPPDNILLLQDIAYLTHECDILFEMVVNQERLAFETQAVIVRNGFNCCLVCYDLEILPWDTIWCPNNCSFCKICVMTAIEIGLQDGQYQFPCLDACGSILDLNKYRAVLPPDLLAEASWLWALDLINSTGIKDMEFCPLCNQFAAIPTAGDKTFQCKNNLCQGVSCRHCKELEHVFCSCDNLESAVQVRARVFVENKMTEAVIRRCPVCELKFVKTDKSNNIVTCFCEARLCYLCGEILEDFTEHFIQEGPDKCRLYTDTITSDKNSVLKAAAKALASLKVSKPLIDPTRGIRKYFRERANKTRTARNRKK